MFAFIFWAQRLIGGEFSSYDHNWYSNQIGTGEQLGGP
jgi:hypothetical protein